MQILECGGTGRSFTESYAPERPTLTASPGTYGECEAVSGRTATRKVAISNLNVASAMPERQSAPNRDLRPQNVSEVRRSVRDPVRTEAQLIHVPLDSYASRTRILYSSCPPHSGPRRAKRQAGAPTTHACVVGWKEIQSTSHGLSRDIKGRALGWFRLEGLPVALRYVRP
jgi:hypothetical protein